MENINEITIPYGEDDYVVAADVTPDDVECIIEALECEDLDVDDTSLYVPRVGRPRKFQSVDELVVRAQRYFDECAATYRPFTLTGVCNSLGTFRDVLDDYASGKYGDEFVEVIRNIKQIVEQGYEERLHGPNATGAIFALKNYGWKDTQGHEISGPGGKPIETKDATDLKEFTKEELYQLLGMMQE